ncbi:MAG: phosphotransferase [Bacteroidales bacterium]|nr:phosphotransferase [Bacteroidales bacterium]
MENKSEIFAELLSQYNPVKLLGMKALPVSGSNRQYFRLQVEEQGKTKYYMGIYHPEAGENKAFYFFTKHFLEKGLKVPPVYANTEDFRYFIVKDLGDETLLKAIEKKKVSGKDEEIIGLYKPVIDDLLDFQLKGIQGLNLDYAYPVATFSEQSVKWDLNYFKYYFVKSHNLNFDEQKLEADFNAFTQRIMASEMNYFNYRDFQARNIMLFEDQPWYIDFQGGRKGPLTYDLVSLLYQAKAGLSEHVRSQLLDYYLLKLEARIPGKAEEVKTHFYDFVYFRLMQVMGAYGFRGLFERKPHFIQSIPLVIESLSDQMKLSPVPEDLPELKAVFNQIIALKSGYENQKADETVLIVSINSFSYKKSGIPLDHTENGGGFVFDCRALPNPGRVEELMEFNGTEAPIIEFLEKKAEVLHFMQHVFLLVDQSVDNYLERKFSHLQVNFGCTGGKHRSVFMAEQLGKHLETRTGVKVVVRHRELE